jgi:flagellar basal-body rod protein FlgG
LFANPEALRELGNARYAASQKSGVLQIGSPTDAGFAAVKSGSLEVSNVDITDELTAMIRAQQQFNGAARLLQTNSELLEKLTR